MKLSISRITDAVATVLLLYASVSEVLGALHSSEQIPFFAFAALCLVLIFAVWKGNTRAKRWVGKLLTTFAILLCLGAMRYRETFPFSVAISIAFLATGIVMIGINRKQKGQ